MSWIDCVVDNDYEIFTEFPHQIRRKSNKRIVSESIDKSSKNGYYICHLNNKKYMKHRIIAMQFVENDDSETKTQVDHIDHDRTNNHINNLRWVSSKENNMNRSTYKGYEAEYFDEIDEDAIIVDTYNTHNFIDYYYVEKEDAFYLYNGIKFRKLRILYTKYNRAFVHARNVDGKIIKIFYSSFKKQYDLI